MTMDQECKFALVEFGECDKNGYIVAQGKFPCTTEPIKAKTYWYPDDITFEEAQQEIIDLAEFYENVLITLPVPEHLDKRIIDLLIDRPDSEVSA